MIGSDIGTAIGEATEDTAGIAGWDQATSQPLHPQRERFGALVRGDDGNAARFSLFRDFGSEVQPPQPPHPRVERWGAVAPSVFIERPFSVWRNLGFEQVASQPPHPRPERAGAIMFGSPGVEALYAALMVPMRWGWLEWLQSMPRFRPQRGVAALPAGWMPEATPVAALWGWLEGLQPIPRQHPRRGEALLPAAWMVDANPILALWGWSEAQTAPGRRRPQPALAGTADEVWPARVNPWGFLGPGEALRRVSRAPPGLATPGDVFGAPAFAWWESQAISVPGPRRRGDSAMAGPARIDLRPPAGVPWFESTIAAMTRPACRRTGAVDVDVFLPPPGMPYGWDAILHVHAGLARRRSAAAAALVRPDAFFRWTVAVFYACSRVTAATSSSEVGAAIDAETRITAATSRTVVKGEPPGGFCG